MEKPRYEGNNFKNVLLKMIVLNCHTSGMRITIDTSCNWYLWNQFETTYVLPLSKSIDYRPTKLPSAKKVGAWANKQKYQHNMLPIIMGICEYTL